MTPRRQPLWLQQYLVVRAREGRRGKSPAYYRMLPQVPPDDPQAYEWQIRAESFARLCRTLPTGGRLRVLDVGAGNGWMSNRLAALGHDVVAIDRLDDADDGLGACRHYETRFGRVLADFDALPFAPEQFDLVVFNGSLHYAPNIPATLARARQMLAPGGVLAVMDSPMFHHETDGHAMVAEKLRRLRSEYGLTDVVHPSVGFLTHESLAQIAASLGLRGGFAASRGSLRWRIGRALSWFRLRRAPAAFGVWLAQW